jgi:hypothetical protein
MIHLSVSEALLCPRIHARRDETVGDNGTQTQAYLAFYELDDTGRDNIRTFHSSSLLNLVLQGHLAKVTSKLLHCGNG